ncbi:MAG TPA: methyl-accepting chemotaxis protein, partial [Spirochaetia bacterium]|nr:methyl-accepting chemotaxis protein [Spirochaetia bacterium]
EKDSFGLALAKMLSSLNNILGEVDSSAEQVSGATRQVSQASQSLSSGASEQASSLEEITSSVTEINSQAKLNAENAIEAKILAETAKQKAEIGNQQMFALVSGMEKINLSSEEIKKIVKVIDNIAFQTNLLALNANVEAARAGKYGKGFAVVAEEVRNLALRSGEAVKETTQMVEESIININKGSKQVEATAEYLQEIMEVVNKVTNIVIEITSSSKEQSQALQQIQEGLSQIEQVTQQNSAYAEETASISEELSSQAFSLKDMISKFKLLKIRQEENQKTMLESISPEMLGQIKKKIASEIKQNGEKHSNH